MCEVAKCTEPGCREAAYGSCDTCGRLLCEYHSIPPVNGSRCKALFCGMLCRAEWIIKNALHRL